MRGAPHDAAQMHGAGQLGIERIGDVVLPHFARAPARDVKPAVVEREIDIRDQGRHRFEALQQGRQLLRFGRLGGNLYDLSHVPVALVAGPQPDRAGEVLERDHDAGEAVALPGVVGGSELERQLLLFAEIEHLLMTPPAQVPDVKAAAVLAAEQQVGLVPRDTQQVGADRVDCDDQSERESELTYERHFTFP
jgi:hypothetical protein